MALLREAHVCAVARYMTDYEAVLRSIPLPAIAGLAGHKVLEAFLRGAEAGWGRGSVGEKEIEYVLAVINSCNLQSADAAVKHMSVAILVSTSEPD